MVGVISMSVVTEDELRDVLAVDLETHKVLIIAERKTPRNANAIIEMAVIRRGVDVDFYVDVPTGAYRHGDVYPSAAKEARDATA